MPLYLIKNHQYDHPLPQQLNAKQWAELEREKKKRTERCRIQSQSEGVRGEVEKRGAAVEYGLRMKSKGEMVDGRWVMSGDLREMDGSSMGNYVSAWGEGEGTGKKMGNSEMVDSILDKTPKEMDALEALFILNSSSSANDDSDSISPPPPPPSSQSPITPPDNVVVPPHACSDVETAGRLLMDFRYQTIEILEADDGYLHPKVKKMMQLSLEELALAPGFVPQTPNIELPENLEDPCHELDLHADSEEKEHHVVALKKAFEEAMLIFDKDVDQAREDGDEDALTVAKDKLHEVRRMAESIYKFFPDAVLPHVGTPAAAAGLSQPLDLAAAETQLAELETRLETLKQEEEAQGAALDVLEANATTALKDTRHFFKNLKRQCRAAETKHKEAIKVKDQALNKLSIHRSKSLQPYHEPVEGDESSKEQLEARIHKRRQMDTHLCDELGEAMAKFGSSAVHFQNKQKDIREFKQERVDEAHEKFLKEWTGVDRVVWGIENEIRDVRKELRGLRSQLRHAKGEEEQMGMDRATKRPRIVFKKKVQPPKEQASMRDPPSTKTKLVFKKKEIAEERSMTDQTASPRFGMKRQIILTSKAAAELKRKREEEMEEVDEDEEDVEEDDTVKSTPAKKLKIKSTRSRSAGPQVATLDEMSIVESVRRPRIRLYCSKTEDAK